MDRCQASQALGFAVYADAGLVARASSFQAPGMHCGLFKEVCQQDKPALCGGKWLQLRRRSNALVGKIVATASTVKCRITGATQMLGVDRDNGYLDFRERQRFGGATPYADEQPGGDQSKADQQGVEILCC